LLIAGVPWLLRSLSTVSTDDAYVNGHVTFVAPRVPGQVVQVYVDDNNRVRKDDLLVQLDKEPYQVQVNISQAAVDAAQADLVAANAQARGIVGQMRSLRFGLDHVIEEVRDQVAVLHSKVADLQSEKATLVKTQADYDRGVKLVATNVITREDFDQRNEALMVAKAKVEAGLQSVFQVRASLGLQPVAGTGDELAQTPPDLEQTFSSVREAQAKVIQAAAQIGYVDTFNKSPKQMIADFYKQDPEGNIDRIYDRLIKNAPNIKQAQAKLMEAQRNLDQANLNLRYCDVTATIDGTVTRRNVNIGNNVVAGQSLMAVRSLTEIWVDANFKETQLANLEIGQPVDLEVDMYGSRYPYKGRISGFTMGTGSTLALLPAENATGNFVKVVQRLPVRIDLLDYHPDTDPHPLFIGLSVEPFVYIKEPPTGKNKGKKLQDFLSLPTVPEPATVGKPAPPTAKP
jgi:membrane fusion protein (multidrug efflux system)